MLYDVIISNFDTQSITNKRSLESAPVQSDLNIVELIYHCQSWMPCKKMISL